MAARLDRFIQLLLDHRAESVQLVPGEAAQLVALGQRRPVTREPLDGAQVMALVREVATPVMRTALEGSAPTSFTYAEGAIPVLIEVVPGPKGPAVTISPAPREAPPREAQARDAVEREAAPHERASARAELEALLRELVRVGGSDLHLRANAPPMLRREGVLQAYEMAPLDPRQLELMLLGAMGASELREFRETNDVDWMLELEDGVRFRFNAGRERAGAFAVARIIPSKLPTAEEIGLSLEVQRLARLTKGLVLVSGPTGSGKSTTLAALIDLVNRQRADHILTVEDPIEFVHQNRMSLVTQRQVARHTKNFASAIRAAMREDPNVVMVGELRDLETVEAAIQLAETGHLVFASTHTSTASTTVERLIDQFPVDRQGQVRAMLSESLRGVVAQTLCRRAGGGRVAAREVLLSIPAISNMIREGKTFQIPSIMQTNRKIGMVTLATALLELVDALVIEPQEAVKHAIDKPGMVATLVQKGLPVTLDDA